MPIVSTPWSELLQNKLLRTDFMKQPSMHPQNAEFLLHQLENEGNTSPDVLLEMLIDIRDKPASLATVQSRGQHTESKDEQYKALLQDRFVIELLDRKDKLDNELQQNSPKLKTLLEAREKIANINLQASFTSIEEFPSTQVTLKNDLTEELTKVASLLKDQSSSEALKALNSFWTFIDPSPTESYYLDFFKSYYSMNQIRFTTAEKLQSLFKVFEAGMQLDDVFFSLNYDNCTWGKEILDGKNPPKIQSACKDMVNTVEEENKSLKEIFENFYEEQADLLIKDFVMELNLTSLETELGMIIQELDTIPGIDGLFIS